MNEAFAQFAFQKPQEHEGETYKKIRILSPLEAKMVLLNLARFMDAVKEQGKPQPDYRELTENIMIVWGLDK
mgnify:CR=1 FL=1